MKISRIKEVFQEQHKTNNWLAEELNVNQVTVSRWCTNVFQPNLETLTRIAKALDVDVRELLVSNKEK